VSGSKTSVSGRLPHSLVLLGAGKMGGAMLQGWLRNGLPGPSVTVIDPFVSDEIRALCRREGIALNPSGSIAEPEVLLLAVKPQSLEEAASQAARLAGPGTLVLSIIAGKTIADFTARLPRAKAIIRTIPNTPAAIGRGVTAACASAKAGAEERAIADALLRAIGKVAWVEDEDLIDAATALSGSGPAYLFLMTEALTEAGIAAGLPPDVAALLARSTVEGAGALLEAEPGTSPAILRKNVTSPNGTTAAALSVLMAEDGLSALMTRAVAAAKRRAAELAG
jgi:pyrroline-5-carboxylate reductase